MARSASSAHLALVVHQRKEIVVAVAIDFEYCSTHVREIRHRQFLAIERVPRPVARDVIALPGVAIRDRLDAAFERLAGAEVNSAEQPAQLGVAARFRLDAVDQVGAMRKHQGQHQLVVEQHHRWLVPLGGENFEHESERTIGLAPADDRNRPCGPDIAGLVAPADALQRAPHRRKLRDRKRIEQGVGLFVAGKFRHGRDDSSCVFGRDHGSLPVEMSAGQRRPRVTLVEGAGEQVRKRAGSKVSRRCRFRTVQIAPHPVPARPSRDGGRHAR